MNIHTRKAYKRAIINATNDWLAKNPNFKWENLTGHKHIKPRSVIFNDGLAKLIPNRVKSSLYYTGQGQMTIVATDYIKFLADKLAVPYDFISHPVHT
jgi:hypothetical protein